MKAQILIKGMLDRTRSRTLDHHIRKIIRRLVTGVGGVIEFMNLKTVGGLMELVLTMDRKGIW